jgi:general secretion pathway protein D
MQDQTTQQLNKIPLLGDIPLLGVLFQNNSTTKTKTELLFFLTPHVAQDASILQPMTNQQIHGLQLAPYAVEPGTFQQDLRQMERGNVSGPPPTLYIPPIPTTRPTSAPGEPNLPSN